MTATFPSPYQRNQTAMLSATCSTQLYEDVDGSKIDSTKNDDLKQQYKEFINKMIEMEHLEPVTIEALKKEASEGFYLPH